MGSGVPLEIKAGLADALAWHRAAAARRCGPRGFALVVVMVLLSLLVLMVLTITTQIQIALQTSRRTVRQAQARENAQLALAVALGQLQRQAGPDQRVTARADIIVNQQQQGQQPGANAQLYWTGVWKTYRPSTPTNQELDTGYDENNVAGLNLRQWSKSANNTAAMDGTPGDPSSTLTGGPQWLVSWPSANTTASLNGTRLNPRLGPPNSDTVPDREVAGPGGLAYKTLARIVDSSTGNLTRVRAWKVDLTAPAAASGEMAKVGAYAYWVSDEGIKAKANLVSPWPSADHAANYAESQLNFLVPQRMAVEKVAVNPALPPSSSATTAAKLAFPPPTDPAHRRMAAAARLSDLASLLPASSFTADGKLAGAPGTGYTFTQRAFPDLTTWSLGVLSNVRQGGLKTDLTAAFEDPLQYNRSNETSGTPVPTSLLGRVRRLTGGADGLHDEKVYRVAEASFPSVTAGGSAFKMNGLRWHTLYLYYNLYKQTLPNPFGGTPPPASFAGPAAGPEANPVVGMRMYTYPTAVREFALMPRMLMVQLYYGISYDGSAKLRFHLYPALVLYNPFNVRLSAPSNLFRFHLRSNAGLTLDVRRPANGGWVNDVPDEGRTYDYIPAPASTEFRFALSTDASANLNLEPGEVRVYSIRTDGYKTEAENIGVVNNLTDQVTDTDHFYYRNIGGTTTNYSTSDSITLGANTFLYSDQIGSLAVSSASPQQLFWPLATSGATQQELARVMFRGFNANITASSRPVMNHTGNNVLKLGGLAFLSSRWCRARCW